MSDFQTVINDWKDGTYDIHVFESVKEEIENDTPCGEVSALLSARIERDDEKLEGYSLSKFSKYPEIKALSEKTGVSQSYIKNTLISGNMDKQDYREVLGQALQSARESKSLSRYAVAQKGQIRIEQVKAVEEGVTNYTIDVFLGYICGSDLFMYFAEEDDKDCIDFKDMIVKGMEKLSK